MASIKGAIFFSPHMSKKIGMGCPNLYFMGEAHGEARESLVDVWISCSLSSLFWSLNNVLALYKCCLLPSSKLARNATPALSSSSKFMFQ